MGRVLMDMKEWWIPTQEPYKYNAFQYNLQFSDKSLQEAYVNIRFYKGLYTVILMYRNVLFKGL